MTIEGGATKAMRSTYKRISIRVADNGYVIEEDTSTASRTLIASDAKGAGYIIDEILEGWEAETKTPEAGDE